MSQITKNYGKKEKVGLKGSAYRGPQKKIQLNAFEELIPEKRIQFFLLYLIQQWALEFAPYSHRLGFKSHS